jgi:hypothetical protein
MCAFRRQSRSLGGAALIARRHERQHVTIEGASGSRLPARRPDGPGFEARLGQIRLVKAKLRGWARRARRGDAEEAERLAGEAVAITGQTQHLTFRADALVDLGAVLELIGKPEDARVALARALELYERKGKLVMAERTRTRLSEASRSA